MRWPIDPAGAGLETPINEGACVKGFSSVLVTAL